MAGRTVLASRHFNMRGRAGARSVHKGVSRTQRHGSGDLEQDQKGRSRAAGIPMGGVSKEQLRPP